LIHKKTMGQIFVTDKIKKNIVNMLHKNMGEIFVIGKSKKYNVLVSLAQLIGTIHNICKGRGFKPRTPPKKI
jgi:hypothetical protein